MEPVNRTYYLMVGAVNVDQLSINKKRKDKEMKQRILSFLTIVVMMISTVYVNASVLEVGTYTILTHTSYANPETGKASDGGSDLAIGDAMARKMTAEKAVYEIKDNKHYITLRFGMNSFIEKPRFKIQSENGKDYKTAIYTIEGEDKEADTKDYRIEIPSLNSRITPVFFVGPMNRDVIFYIKLDPDSLEKNGNLLTKENEIKVDTPVKKEDNKMPELVENLTGISEIKQDIAPDINSQVNPVSGSETPPIKDEGKNTYVSEGVEQVRGDQREESQAISQELTQDDDMEKAVQEKTEDVKIKNTAVIDEEVQGITEFDATGDEVVPKDEKEKGDMNLGLAVMIGIVVLGAAGYIVYKGFRN